MKKLVILAMVLALLLGGCSWLSGTATTPGAVATAQQQLCNPNPSQQAVATAIINFLSAGVGIAAPIAGIPITPAVAQGVFTAIENGLCVGATNLQLALTWYNAIAAKSVVVTKGVAPSSGPLYTMFKGVKTPIPDSTILYGMFSAGK